MKKYFVIIFVTYLVSPLYSETIYLKEGTVVRGTILDETKWIVLIKNSIGSLTIDKKDIERIDYTQDAPKPKESEEEKSKKALGSAALVPNGTKPQVPKFFASLDYFNVADAYKDYLDTLQPTANLFVKTVGYDSASYKSKITTGIGVRWGVLLPLQTEATYLGGSLGYITGPTNETNWDLRSRSGGNATSREYSKTTFWRLLGEIRKTIPLSDLVSLDLGAGLGLAFGKMEDELTNTGSLVTVLGLAPKYAFSQSWNGITWEVAPRITYQWENMSGSIGVRYAGLPTMDSTENLDKFKWTPFGFFVELGW